MTTINCTICLDILSSKPFGNTAPCGHYFHEECYNRWVASSGRHSTVTGELVAKCPTCNTCTTDFIRSYLDLGRLAVDDDDVSISSVESDIGDCDVCDDCDNDDGVEVENNAHDGNGLSIGQDKDDDGDDKSVQSADESIDSFEKRLNSINSRRTSPSRSSSTNTNTTSSTLDGEIIILDSDGEDATTIQPACISLPLPTTNKSKRKSSKSTRTNSNSSSKSSSKSTTTSTNNDNDKLKKKYKLLKRKLSAMKESVADHQKLNKNLLQIRSEHKTLQEHHKEQTSQYEHEIYQHQQHKKELKDISQKVTQLEKERSALKERLLSESNRAQKERDRLRDMVENARANNMAEVKEIAKQKDTLLSQYNDLVKEWKIKDVQSSQLEKENAQLKRLLQNSASREVEALIQKRKKAKMANVHMSRSKKIELMNSAIRDAEEERMREENEARLRRQQADRRNMLKKSSQQMSRVLAAANKQKQARRKARPKLTSAIGNAAAAAPDVGTGAGSGGHQQLHRKKPSAKLSAAGMSKDLRHMFKRR